MIKCCCKDKFCPIKIIIEERGILHFIDKKGEETVMYLDANSIVELIKDLKKTLNNLVLEND